MITSSEIKDLRGQQKDYHDTQKLKKKLSHFRETRNPLFLNLEDFNLIRVWKLDTQIGRNQHLWAINTDSVVRQVTSLALNVVHADKDYEVELRVNILCSLRGVGIPIASSVLALIFPEEYAVIDYRGWRQVFGNEKNTFLISEYKKYLHEMRLLARELNWPVQEVDYAIWEYDRRQKASK